MNLKTTFNSNTYRIVDYCLLKFFKTNNIDNFKYLEYSDERPTPTLFKHFVSNENDLEQTVWTDGEYAHRINKVYDSLPLITPTKNLELNSSTVSVVLKQGFSWTEVFGIHVLIKGTQSKDVYTSKVLFINDFKINENKELIQGSFWVEQSDIKIPYSDEILACQITTITYKDIQSDGPNIGYIYNYPEFLEPLIGEKPIPDFIQTKLEVDPLSNYIKITPYTTEQKTLEKSILDYFGQSMADINISHVIKFGNDEDGYHTLRVQNDNNKFGEIFVGLDFSQFDKTSTYDEINEDIINLLGKHLFEEIEVLKLKISNLEAATVIDKATIDRLEDEIIRLNGIITNHLNTIDSLNTEISNLEAATVIDKSTIDRLESDIINLNGVITTLRAEIKKLNEELIIDKETIDSLILEISELKAATVIDKATIQSLNERISELEAATVIDKATIKSLNERISELEAATVIDKATIQSLNERISELVKDIDNRDITIKSLYDKILKLEDEALVYNETIAEKILEIENLNKILNENRLLISSMTTEIEWLKKASEKDKATIAEKILEIERLDTLNNKLTSDILLLTTENNNLKTDILLLTTENNKLTSDILLLTTENATLDNEIAQAIIKTNTLNS